VITPAAWAVSAVPIQDLVRLVAWKVSWTELGKKVPGRVSAAGAERVRPHDLAYLGLVSGFWVGGIWRARRDHILHRCAAPWVGSWPPVMGEGEKLPDHRRDRGVSNGVRTYCRGEKSGRDTNRDGSEER